MNKICYLTFITLIFYNVKGGQKQKKLTIYNFNDFISNSIRTNSTFIFEYNKYHHECIPGFVKHFEDLDFIKILLKAIGACNSPHSYFVAHDTNFARKQGMEYYFDKGRIFKLGYFQSGVQVNPHYYGDIKLYNKNKHPRFFMTSTIYREYKTFVNATEVAESERLDFEVVVTGRNKVFSEKNLPKQLKSHYHFKHYVPYIEMYKEIEKSDFIIVTLDPNNKDAKIFKTLRCSGSIQLGYGFYKPMLIHEEYAALYNLTNSNSFLFNDENFGHIFKKAIKLTNKEYHEKQINLIKTANSVYDLSLKNLKKFLNLEKTN